MSRPLPAQARDLVKQIRRLDPPDGEHNWTQLERLLLTALECDKAGTIEIDGYPRSTMRAGANGATPVDPNDPDAGTVTLTSVEAAANILVFGQPERDQLRDHLNHALDFLDEAVRAVGAFANRMTAIERLTTPPASRTKFCEGCLPHGQRHSWDHYGDVGQKLPKPMQLCSEIYQFVVRNGRLPTAEEHQRHTLTGRWRVHVS